MVDRKQFMSNLEGLTWADWREHHSDSEVSLIAREALALLREQENEYEHGFNDAMLGRQELMYEAMDGKWYKKDW